MDAILPKNVTLAVSNPYLNPFQPRITLPKEFLIQYEHLKLVFISNFLFRWPKIHNCAKLVKKHFNISAWPAVCDYSERKLNNHQRGPTEIGRKLMWPLFVIRHSYYNGLDSFNTLVTHIQGRSQDFRLGGGQNIYENNKIRRTRQLYVDMYT